MNPGVVTDRRPGVVTDRRRIVSGPVLGAGRTDGLGARRPYDSRLRHRENGSAPGSEAGWMVDLRSTGQVQG
jgi:hypothetical protein